MDKKIKNRFDFLVENLTVEFSKIKNIELLIEDEKTRKLWNYLINTIFELNSIKGLYVGIYIPQTNKFIHDWKQEFTKSKYSSLVTINSNSWEQEINQLLRTGYVTLFHKYEGFASNILNVIDEHYIDFEDTSINLESYAIKEFDFKLDKNWYINSFVKKINWICNSEKHNEGYPKITHSYYKETSLAKLLHPEKEKICLTSDELKVDIESMIALVRLIFQVSMLIALYRSSEESNKSFEYGDEDFYKEQSERFNQIKSQLQKMISLIKEFG